MASRGVSGGSGVVRCSGYPRQRRRARRRDDCEADFGSAPPHHQREGVVWRVSEEAKEREVEGRHGHIEAARNGIEQQQVARRTSAIVYGGVCFVYTSLAMRRC